MNMIRPEFVTGLAARERQITHPTLTATSFKRFMGSNRSILPRVRHTLRPEELSAMVLRSLKADAEMFLGEPVVEAVITVPAYFNDKQRKATRRAGELAGFKVERLLSTRYLRRRHRGSLQHGRQSLGWRRF
jgi:molecular chaperone HscC